MRADLQRLKREYGNGAGGGGFQRFGRNEGCSATIGSRQRSADIGIGSRSSPRRSSAAVKARRTSDGWQEEALEDSSSCGGAGHCCSGEYLLGSVAPSPA